MPKRTKRRLHSPLPIYYSHSYRGTDREVNEFFWQLFWEAGFTFTVDPQSDVLSTPYLEYMMQGSAGFVAVVTQRPEQLYYLCSPFILYECSLAFLAHKPRLILVESGVSGKYFPADTQVFHRDRLESDRELFKTLIDDFQKRVSPYRRAGVELLDKVGILIDPKDSTYAPVLNQIEDVVEKHGFKPELIPLDEQDTLDIVLQVDAYDFVIVDLAGDSVPAWMYPYIHGRFIPSFKLMHIEVNKPVDLPPLLRTGMLRGVPPVDQPVLFWRDPELLIGSLDAQMAKLKNERQEFSSLDAGLKYFRKAGRREASVFISNANESNRFAIRLTDALQEAGIGVFHYIEANQIPLGTDWKPRLKREVKESEIFVLLVTNGYLKSEWCEMELKLAKESGATVVPYFLENVKSDKIPTQGRSLVRKPDEMRLETIVGDLDTLLRESRPKPRIADTGPVDIAIITILKEEYQAVLRHIQNNRPAPATRQQPNAWAWELGEVKSPTYGNYRVVLAFAGQAGTTNAVNVTRDTAQRWKPKYILLVGIAGGFPIDGLEKGDVVVSKAIWEYEYGKIDEGFTPRMDLIFPCDGRLVRSAEILPVREIEWNKLMRQHPPSGGANASKVRVGPVASGNKVIDNIADEFFERVRSKWPKLIAVEMEGAGAAAAVRSIGESQTDIRAGFAMIRGISDMPPAGHPGADQVSSVSSQTAQRDLWKLFACDAAACFAVQLISLGWPVPPRS